MRPAILDAVHEALQAGLTIEKACDVLGLSVKTVQRWMSPKKKKKKMAAHSTWNSLTPQDNKLINDMIRAAAYADFSARELSLTALEEEGRYISHVAFWAAQVTIKCNGPRRGKRLPRGCGNKPDTSWVDGPNQLWSWDISHIHTGRPHEFWYLYALQDWHSRKVVAWVVTDSLLSITAQELWDQGLLNENVLLTPSSEWPDALNDRGTQMRSKSTRSYFKRLGVTQIFARPKTPNDNPKIEALFSVTKSEPEYPGHFPRLEDAIEYFKDFFNWYNAGHPHTALNMLTPNQVHSGEGLKILDTRKSIRENSMSRRRHHFETGEELKIDFRLPGKLPRRSLPIRFQSLEIPSINSAKKTRHLLTN